MCGKQRACTRPVLEVRQSLVLTGEFLGCAGKERAWSAVMCLTQKCNSVIGKKWQDDDLRFGRAVVFAVYTRIVRFTVNLNPLTTIDAATICSCGAHRISAGDSYPPTLLTCDYSHFVSYFRVSPLLATLTHSVSRKS